MRGVHMGELRTKLQSPEMMMTLIILIMIKAFLVVMLRVMNMDIVNDQDGEDGKEDVF